MKSFQYKATDQQGELIEGQIQAGHFAEAEEKIRSQGRALIGLEEIVAPQAEHLKSFLFEAVDAQGETLEGSVQASSEEELRKKLQDEMKVQVQSIHEKEDRHEEAPLIFDHSSARPARDLISEAEFQAEETRLQRLFDESLLEETKKRLEFLQTQVQHIRSTQNKKSWNELKSEIDRVEKKVKREIGEGQEKEWSEFSHRVKEERVEYSAAFEGDEPPVKKKPFKKLSQLVETMKNSREIIDDPHEAIPTEVLLKQQYETVWNELRLLSGFLLMFYLTCFFIGYYVRRSGAEDHFFLRIYDAILFKQIVLGLFGFFVATTLRRLLPWKSVKTDTVITVLWLILLFVIL